MELQLQTVVSYRVPAGSFARAVTTPSWTSLQTHEKLEAQDMCTCKHLLCNKQSPGLSGSQHCVCFLCHMRVSGSPQLCSGPRVNCQSLVYSRDRLREESHPGHTLVWQRANWKEKLGVVTCTCDCSVGEPETGGSLEPAG